MDSQDKNPGKKQGTSEINWASMFFPTNEDIASPRVKFVKNGPYGNSRMANSSEIKGLLIDAEREPKNFIRVLDSFVVAHDIGCPPKAIHLGCLPLHCGTTSPNILAIGPSGTGKTQKVTLPALRHCIQNGLNILHINVKGDNQTTIVEMMAKEAYRSNDVKVIRPMATTKGGFTFSGLQGCENPSQAARVASRLAQPGLGDWPNLQTKEYLTSAILAICNDLTPPRRNLLELRKTVVRGNYKGFANAHPRWVGLQRFANYLDGINQNAATVASSISEKTAFIDDTPHFFSGSNEINPSDIIRKGGIIVFEIDEANIPILGPVINLFASYFIESLQSFGGINSPKWIVCLDELSVLNCEPAFVNSLHTCREKNYNFIAGVQTINQLSVYGPKATSILSGFQTKVVFPGSDLETSDYFSKASGCTSVQYKGSVLARPLLQASDISAPSRNRLLGPPATIFSGCGLRPFQAYLGSFYDDGRFSKLTDEAAQETKDEVIEEKTQNKSNLGGLLHGGHDVASALNLEEAIEYESFKILIGWNVAESSTLNWIRDLEDQNIDRPKVLLKLVQEIAIRGATIEDFFISYVHANTTDIAAILCFMDYTKLKNQAQLGSKKGKNKKAEEVEEDTEDTF